MYIATKGAIEQTIRALARESSLTGPERRITVNVVAPGAVTTEAFSTNVPEFAREHIANAHPQKRIAAPADVSVTLPSGHDPP
jgi:NAD(P)-dependent dehydrogenase (short-subunit alcohol dehydrogenase family)